MEETWKTQQKRLTCISIILNRRSINIDMKEKRYGNKIY